MPTLFFNKYLDWSKDMTYKESDRKDLSYYTLKDFTDEEFEKLSDHVKTTVNEIKTLIDNII